MDDGAGELVGGGVATQVLGADLAGLQDIVDGTVDLLAVVRQIDVAQHFRCAEQHGRWVGNVLADSLREGVTCTLKMVFMRKCFVENTRKANNE